MQLFERWDEKSWVLAQVISQGCGAALLNTGNQKSCEAAVLTQGSIGKLWRLDLLEKRRYGFIELESIPWCVCE